MIAEASVTVRDVLCLLLAADSYPRLGNHDWCEADLLEAEALQKAQTAEPRADDPPEFARWLATLLTPGLSNTDRGEVYFALHDFFDIEPTITSAETGHGMRLPAPPLINRGHS